MWYLQVYLLFDSVKHGIEKEYFTCVIKAFYERLSKCETVRITFRYNKRYNLMTNTFCTWCKNWATKVLKRGFFFNSNSSFSKLYKEGKFGDLIIQV